MNILYLHGLEGKLSRDKRAFLEGFCKNVIAPDMDYFTNSDVLKMIQELNDTYKFNVLIGSSMGGFMGFNVANTIKCPALLFNPAILQKKVKQNIPKLIPANASPFLHFAVGGKDKLVDPDTTLAWLIENKVEQTHYAVSIRKDMEHRVPLEDFKEEVRNFFKKGTEMGFIK